jgi:hypothetical protein
MALRPAASWLIPTLVMAQASALSAQRATVSPMAVARPPARIELPVVAFTPDSTYTLVLPSLYEPRAVYRQVAGEWSISDAAFARDSTTASRIVGQAVGLYVEGASVGAGRIRQVAPGFCGDPPDWCPTRATIEVIGALTRNTPPIMAISPPPTHAAEVVDPTEDEVATAARALLAVFRTSAGPRLRVTEEQMAPPTVFAVNDVDNSRRILVAHGSMGLGTAGSYSGLVVGIVSDTLLRAGTGRAIRLPAGQSEELRYVGSFDFNGDGRDELFLGWLSGQIWSFEVLSPDRLGRYSQHWRGPDRSIPAPARGRR